jgi:hypothetical protein
VLIRRAAVPGRTGFKEADAAVLLQRVLHDLVNSCVEVRVAMQQRVIQLDKKKFIKHIKSQLQPLKHRIHMLAAYKSPILRRYNQLVGLVNELKKTPS